MNPLLAIKSLYVLNGFVAVLLYLPQLCRALKDKNHALSLSPVTFGGWSVGSLVTAIYAWFFVKDPIFTVISVGNMAGSGTIFVIVVWGRIGFRPGFLIRSGTTSRPATLATGDEPDSAVQLAQQLP